VLSIKRRTGIKNIIFITLRVDQMKICLTQMLLAFLVIIHTTNPTEPTNSIDVSTLPGIDKTGINDCTAIIQEALNALATNFCANGAVGVSLYFPQGTYRITDRLVFDNTSIGITNVRRQGITIRGAGFETSRILVDTTTDKTKGAFLFKLDVSRPDEGMYNCTLQIEDLRILANLPAAETAIEVTPYDAGESCRITTKLRSVRIDSLTSTNYFSYGFKGEQLYLPVMDSVYFDGLRTGSLAGLYFTNTYGGIIRNCTISGADKGVQWANTGEANSVLRSTISDVNVGVDIFSDCWNYIGPSTMGGEMTGNTISAYGNGAVIDYKGTFFISDNSFNKLGSGTFTHLELHDSSEINISDNVFNGGSSQAAISLSRDANTPTGRQAYWTTIAYNQFSDTVMPCISVDTNVVETKIIGNKRASGGNIDVVDNGTYTYIANDSIREVCSSSSPTTNMFAPSCIWGFIRPSHIVNVKNYGAYGNGTINDTAAILAAAAQMKSNLDTYGTAGLYFPAGKYIFKDQIDLIQPADKTWNNIRIYGDGMQTTLIDNRDSNTVFNISCADSAEVRMHNMSINAVCLSGASAPAILMQNSMSDSPTTNSSFIMHDFEISKFIGAYYKGAVIQGANLIRPVFKDLLLTGDNAYTNYTETAIHLSNSAGAELEDTRLAKWNVGMQIYNNTGKPVLIRGPLFAVNTIIGAVIRAGGQEVAVLAAHIDTRDFNLKVIDANRLNIKNTLTLTRDLIGRRTGMLSTLYLASCENVEILDNIFWQVTSTSVTENPLRVTVRPDTAITDYEVSGNMFCEMGYGIVVPSIGTGAMIYDNRFLIDSDITQTIPYTPIQNNDPNDPGNYIELLPPETVFKQ
jgi:hypothetical protein